MNNLEKIQALLIEVQAALNEDSSITGMFLVELETNEEIISSSHIQKYSPAELAIGIFKTLLRVNNINQTKNFLSLMLKQMEENPEVFQRLKAQVDAE